MIKRKLYSDLKSHLSQKEMTLIVGPRQAGKTTLMLQLKRELEQEGRKTLFLNLDIEADKEYVYSQAKLVSKIKLEMGSEPGFIFIDEIQRKGNAGLFLKGIYDMNLPYKFILSGSGSVELKESIHESLTGRKRIFELFPLSFEELVNFRTNYAYEEKLDDFFNLETTKTNELFEEYLHYGGYPRVVLEETLDGKRAILEEIYQSYIEKDITALLKIKKTADFSHLVRIMASQIGRLVTLSELSSTLGISYPTLQHYLWYLEKTFVLEKVSPYFRNVRKEITKSPIYYFCDLGLRNYIRGIFGQLLPDDRGFLFQNFVYLRLHECCRSPASKVAYWRTKSGAEVDFVVEAGGNLIPIEVKYTSLHSTKLTRSLRSFIEKYHPPHAYVIHLATQKQEKIEDTLVHFIPFYQGLGLL